MQWKQGIWTYASIVLLSLCVILFVGTTVDPVTGVESKELVTNGITQFKKGMDVAGGVRLYYKVDLTTYETLYTDPVERSQVTSNILNIILQNIDGRVSGLGVNDYESRIQTLEDGQYVVIDLGGVYDLEQAKEIIGKTVELEFKTPYTGDGSELVAQRQQLAESVLRTAVPSDLGFQELYGDQTGNDVFVASYTDSTLAQLPQLYQDNPELLAMEVGSTYPTLVEGVYETIPAIPGITTEPELVTGYTVVKLVNRVEQEEGETLYSFEDIFISSTPQWVNAVDSVTNEILNGAYFRYASIGQGQTGEIVVAITFDDRGSEIFCNLTGQIVGQQMAIFVGGKLTTAPVIREKICGGTAQISGNYNTVTAKELVDDLNEGALPAPLVLAHEEKVSPTLGEKALTGAIWAGIIGLLAVAGFMTYYYGPKRGFVATLTIVCFLVILFALIKLLGTALSLSGIAAILLTIGMAVDANVLIYERVDEETSDGARGSEAIMNGYEKSRSAIRDGNITTGMIALLLFFVGTNVFKGFGTMMLVNIVLTLTVVVPLTKYLLLMISDVISDSVHNELPQSNTK